MSHSGQRNWLIRAVVVCGEKSDCTGQQNTAKNKKRTVGHDKADSRLLSRSPSQFGRGWFEYLDNKNLESC
jgi:hypothetical protein